MAHGGYDPVAAARPGLAFGIPRRHEEDELLAVGRGVEDGDGVALRETRELEEVGLAAVAVLDVVVMGHRRGGSEDGDAAVVPVEEVPDDALDVFRSVLDSDPALDKVGFSLRLDDLPQHYAHRDDVVLWESQFWRRRHASGHFIAEIDTTFAMYRPGEHHQNNRAVRTAPPYTARHMPWYQDSANPTAEHRYYVEHADSLIINWDKKELPASLRAHLRVLRTEHAAGRV